MKPIGSVNSWNNCFVTTSLQVPYPPPRFVNPVTFIGCHAHVQTLLHFSYFWDNIDPGLTEHALARQSVGGFILQCLRRLRALCAEPPLERPAANAAAVAAGEAAIAAGGNRKKAHDQSIKQWQAKVDQHASDVQHAYFDVMMAVGKFRNPRGQDFELKCVLCI